MERRKRVDCDGWVKGEKRRKKSVYCEEELKCRFEGNSKGKEGRGGCDDNVG